MSIGSVEIRTRDEEVFDGSTGAKIDTLTTYDLGAEIDGVFVPFLSKAGGYIGSLVERGKAAQQAAQPAEQPQAETVAPVIPADQAAATEDAAPAAAAEPQGA